MYVAGTKSAGDVWDDLKIPFGLTAWSQRYKDAESTLNAMPQSPESWATLWAEPLLWSCKKTKAPR